MSQDLVQDWVSSEHQSPCDSTNSEEIASTQSFLEKRKGKKHPKTLARTGNSKDPGDLLVAEPPSAQLDICIQEDRIYSSVAQPQQHDVPEDAQDHGYAWRFENFGR